MAPRKPRRQGKPRRPQIVATLPPGGKWGAAMARLSDRERNFVHALFLVPNSRGGKEGGATMAADLAGLGTESSSRQSLQVLGSVMCSDERIQRALAEECRKRIKAIGPQAVKAIEAMVADGKHKDHFRAASTVIDRIDPPRVLQQVDVSHRHEVVVPPSEVLKNIADMAKAAGVTLKALPKMIDVTPERTKNE